MRQTAILLGILVANLDVCVHALSPSQTQCGSGSGACPWSTGGGQLCCSSSGMCGDTEGFCGKGCQYRYGRCYFLRTLATPGDAMTYLVAPPTQLPPPSWVPAPAISPSGVVAPSNNSQQPSVSPSVTPSPAPVPPPTGVVASLNHSKQPQQPPDLPQYQEVNVMGASDVTVYGRRMLSSA